MKMPPFPPQLIPAVSSKALAMCVRKTAEFMESVAKEHNSDAHIIVASLVEVARRLESMDSELPMMKAVEDLSRRIFDEITPETVALGPDGLKKRLVQVIAAN